MISEKFPGLLELPTEDKWSVVHELWQSLASEAGMEPADPGIAALLEERFQAYLADPTQAIPANEMWERLGLQKRACTPASLPPHIQRSWGRWSKAEG
jgi:putative addiction module component (TIGR02574 family)